MKFSASMNALIESLEEALAEMKDAIYPENNNLHKACRYVLEGPGKRIRPLLTLLSAAAIDEKKMSWALSAALAVEMIHSYSLVHDDLPALDDDDLRRGRPTVHKAFGEATAILVGDTLQSDAFAILSTSPTPISAEQKLALIKTLATEIGARGMVLGQDLDLTWTGRDDYTEETLNRIHELKTGKLMAASCRMGALSAGSDETQASALYEFGSKLGLAFQIIDDLLDISVENGKTQGKDIAQNKLTFLKHYSHDQASQIAETLTQEAFEILNDFGESAQPLRELSELLLKRKS
jgi:geranylgeranyl pyrophosphate synthase